MNEKQLLNLHTFLHNAEIPTIKRNPKTFLGIAKQPHYENVLSNIYAFYFNPNEEHKLSDLFISSLHELINESKIGKTKDIGFKNNFEINTEWGTNKNGRIDLLLSNEDYAIIIENKVYHHLNNNLNDYWDSILNDKPDENKIGIVLSLKPHSENEIKHNHFINITHLDFLKRVMANSGNYLLNAEDKYVIFLKDLFQNIINLSNFMQDDTLQFYFKNQKEINNVVKIKTKVNDFIKGEVRKVVSMTDENLKYFKPRGNNEYRLRYYYSPIHKDLMITVVFNELLTSKKNLGLYVELNYGTIAACKEFPVENFNDTEKTILRPAFKNNKNKTWAHIASKTYELSEDNIKNLSDYILEKIEDDGFLSIYRKLNAFLSEGEKE